MKDVRICFIGDSFVNGTGDENALGWAGRLCAEANKKGTSVTYYNLGIRRNTSHDILQRINSEVSIRLPPSLDCRVVLSFGVNDTVIEEDKVRVSEEDSINNFEKIVNLMKENYKVIMVGPPPINNDEHDLRISSLNNGLRNKAKELGISFIELYSHLVGDEEYQKEITENDGAHPRGGGYEKLAKIIGSSEVWWF